MKPLPVGVIAVCLFACLAVSSTANGQGGAVVAPPKIVPHQITFVRDWVAAADRHIPGELDAGVAALAAWTQDDVAHAWLDVQAIIAIVERPSTTRFTARPSGQTVDVSASPALEIVRKMAASIRNRPGGPARFYKRAAVLHSDLAMSVKGGGAATPSGSMMVTTRDGDQVGVHGSVVHWEFGRLLLDAVPRPQEDEFVRDWYRASMGFKLRVGDLDTTHFDRAAELFPRDAIVRFQTGSLHEWLADPRVRAAAETVSLPRGTRLEVQSEDAELRQAETHYKRALENDLAHVEARVRWGRVLGRLGRHEEAATQLRQAVGRATEPLVAYYAHLFLGAEEEALGRSREAREAYAHAAALYPRAQTPRLGLSQLSHHEGDRPGARAALAPALTPGVTVTKDDPWWTYRSAPARHTDDLVTAMYRTLAAGGTR